MTVGFDLAVFLKIRINFKKYDQLFYLVEYFVLVSRDKIFSH
jgi:hypothetical protein